eukprot:341446-Rhodomonas_salina.2
MHTHAHICTHLAAVISDGEGRGGGGDVGGVHVMQGRASRGPVRKHAPLPDMDHPERLLLRLAGSSRDAASAHLYQARVHVYQARRQYTLAGTARVVSTHWYRALCTPRFVRLVRVRLVLRCTGAKSNDQPHVTGTNRPAATPNCFDLAHLGGHEEELRVGVEAEERHTRVQVHQRLPRGRPDLPRRSWYKARGSVPRQQYGRASCSTNVWSVCTTASVRDLSVPAQEYSLGSPGTQVRFDSTGARVR